MNYFFGEQGVFEKHSLSYGLKKQPNYMEKETFSNYEFGIKQLHNNKSNLHVYLIPYIEEKIIH